MKQLVLQSHFKKFFEKQRKNVYQQLDDIQKERWIRFIGSGLNSKVLKELVYELIGSKPNDEIVRVFRAITKMYCGQLVEEARLVQIDELAFKHGGKEMLPETLPLAPLKPSHLQEARRRMIKQKILVPPAPKSMFLSRR
mmetsp:Transcript_16068/g.27119  ORF Transcript_16068/g.27119 Transcript_16068/m.27119 type:complete len:140 (-) Transcript_16068:39-458(-)